MSQEKKLHDFRVFFLRISEIDKDTSGKTSYYYV